MNTVRRVTVQVRNLISEQIRTGYLGGDFPEVWDIERGPVLLQFDNPKHFRLDEADGVAEWKAIVPENGIVYLGPYRQPFGVAMFHQLRCLDILRADMVRPRNQSTGPRHSPYARHCLNYLRQMVLCHGDLELESFQFASRINPINWRGVYECMDWEAVYRKTRKNQQEYREWLASPRS